MPVTPPLGFPSSIKILNIAPGHFGSSGAGGIVRADGDMIARIAGDDFGVFSVLSMETLELVHDPDAPPGTPRVWETTATVDGPGPISVGTGTALIVFAGFACPILQPRANYAATIEVVRDGTQQPAVLEIPLGGSTDQGGLAIIATSTPPLFADGQAVFRFRLNSTLLNEIAGVFTCDPAPGDDSPFRSDIEPQFPTIPPGGQVEFDLPITCPAGTAEGDYNVLFGLKNITDKNFLFSQRIPVTVKAVRAVQVIPSLLLPDLTLAQGDSVLCELRFIVSGGPGVLSISPGALPFMVTLDNAQQTAQVDGEVFMGVTINVDPHAPLNTAPEPLTINWTLAADSLHDAVSGSVTFNLRIVAPEPAELSFDIDSITFDDSTSANGNVHAVFRRDGSFNFHGHFHNSGAIDINYQLAAAVLDAQGNLYTMVHSGRVAGSLSPGSPDDNWAQEERNDAIVRNWVVLLEGGLQFKALASASTDFAGITGTALGTALGITGVVLGVIALV